MSKKEFRLPKVSFYTDNEKVVVATVKFNGKRLKAISKCSPEDTFDFEIGKNLAKDRVLLKFYRAKYKHLCESVDAWRDAERFCKEKIGKFVNSITDTVNGYAKYCGVDPSEVEDKLSD